MLADKHRALDFCGMEGYTKLFKAQGDWDEVLGHLSDSADSMLLDAVR